VDKKSQQASQLSANGVAFKLLCHCLCGKRRLYWNSCNRLETL